MREQSSKNLFVAVGKTHHSAYVNAARVPRRRDRLAFYPCVVFLAQKRSRLHLRNEPPSGQTSEMSFHAGINHAKDGGKRCAWSVQFLVRLEVEAALALIPKKGKIGGGQAE